MATSVKKWLPGFFMLLLGVALRALDWIGKADTLASLFNRLPSWMRFIGNPVIDLLFILGGFFLLYWATREKQPAGPALLGPRGETLSSVRVSKRKLFIIAGVAVVTGVCLAFGVWLSLSRQSITTDTAKSDGALPQESQSPTTDAVPTPSEPKPEQQQLGSEKLPDKTNPKTSGKNQEEKPPETMRPEAALNSSSESQKSSQPQEPPLPIQRVTVTSKRVSSDVPKYPYGLQLVLQTTVPISRPHFRIEFDEPAYNRSVRFAGVFSRIDGYAEYQTPSTIYQFSFQMPAFEPDTPLIVNVVCEKPCKFVSLKYAR